MTPRQGNELPAAGFYAADNGCGPGKHGVGAGFPGNDAYLHWLMKLDAAEGGDLCDPTPGAASSRSRRVWWATRRRRWPAPSSSCR
jgi:hypothetical protein